MIFLKIALLNLTSHYKRTILIIFAVMISVFMLESISGMMEGLRHSFFQSLMQESGHIQIHEKGWEDRMEQLTLDYRIEQPDRLISYLTRTYDEIVRAEKLLSFGALLIHGEKNLAIMGQGVEPDTAFFGSVREGIVEGEFFSAAETAGGSETSSRTDEKIHGAVLSRRICDLLDLSLGDGVVALVEDSEGSPYYLEYPVTGIFESGSKETDEQIFFLTHANAQELLYLPDETTEIRITLTDRENAEAIAADIEESLAARSGMQGRTGSPADGQRSGGAYEVATWQELNGSFILFIEMFDVIMLIINVFIIIVAATVITNAILMNVFERVREYGTMRAIGMKKRQMFWLVMMEGGAQGTIGSIIGMAMAIPLVIYLQIHGFSWGALSEVMTGSSIYYFRFSPVHAAINFASGILIALAGSLYAARVNTRMDVVETLRFN